jgi:hypothetical protein
MISHWSSGADDPPSRPDYANIAKAPRGPHGLVPLARCKGARSRQTPSSIMSFPSTFLLRAEGCAYITTSLRPMTLAPFIDMALHVRMISADGCYIARNSSRGVRLCAAVLLPSCQEGPASCDADRRPLWQHVCNRLQSHCHWHGSTCPQTRHLESARAQTPCAAGCPACQTCAQIWG